MCVHAENPLILVDNVAVTLLANKNWLDSCYESINDYQYMDNMIGIR